MKALERYPDMRRLIRFVLVGAAATLTHMAVASVLYALWGADYVWPANFAAWLAAFGVSFWGHQRVTFRRRTTLGRFLVMSLSGLAVNHGLLGLLLLTSMPTFIAMISAIVLAAAVSYLVARQYTFAAPEQASGGA